MEKPIEIVNTTTAVPQSTPDVREVLSHPGAVTIYILLSFFSLFLLVCVFGLLMFISQRIHRVTVKRKHSRRLVEATRKALKKLALRTLAAADKEVVSGSEQCAVCIEIYRAFDVVRILPCRHMFHKKCIDPWLLERRSCPLCKLDILISCGIAMDIPSVMSSDYSSSGSSVSEVHLRLSRRQTWISKLMVALLGYSRVPHSNAHVYRSGLHRDDFPDFYNRRLYLPGNVADRGLCLEKQSRNFQSSIRHGTFGLFSDSFRCCCCLLNRTQRLSHAHNLGPLTTDRHAQSRDRLCEYHASVLGVTAMPPTVQLAYYECYSSHANAIPEQHTHSSPSGVCFDSVHFAPSPHKHFTSWQFLARITQFVKQKCALLQRTSTEMRETIPRLSPSPSVKRHFVKSAVPRTNANLHREKVLVHTVREGDSSPDEPSLKTVGRDIAASSRSLTRAHSSANSSETPKVTFGDCKSEKADTNPDSDEISECSLVVLPSAIDGYPFAEASVQPPGADSSSVEFSPRSLLIGCSDSTFDVNRSRKPQYNTRNSINGKLVLLETSHSADTKRLGHSTQGYESIYRYGLPEHASPPPYHLVVTRRDMADDFQRGSVSASPYSAVTSYSPCCPMCRAARAKSAAEVYCEMLLHEGAPSGMEPGNDRRSKLLFRSPSLPPHAQSLEVRTQFHGALDSASTDETEHMDGAVAHSLMHGVRVIVEPPEVQYHGGSPVLGTNTGSTDDWESANCKACANSEPATLKRHVTGDQYANLSATV